MKVKWEHSGRDFRLTFELDPKDPKDGNGQGTLKVGFLSNSIKIKLPVPAKRPHPDLLAFAALVAVRPWIADTLVVDAPVSVEFAEMVKKLFKITVSPTSPNVTPRKPGRTPVVSFSGGVDSVAASEVFPQSIPYIYYKRVDHHKLPNRAPTFQVDAITDVVQKVKDAGRNVFMVESDLEHICTPFPTLPHWFAIAIGVMLLADELDAGLLVMGGTLETYFMDMGRKWRGVQGKGLDPLADLIGLPICRPMLGVTEIGTMKIAMGSDFGTLARSCVLGTREKACGKCAKCVRKMLISEVLQGGVRKDSELVGLADSDPGVKANSNLPPYYMQAQFEYCLSRPKGLSGPLKDLYDRLGRPKKADTDWMLTYYSPASEISIPANWRAAVEYEIMRRLPEMTKAQMTRAEKFNRTTA